MGRLRRLLSLTAALVLTAAVARAQPSPSDAPWLSEGKAVWIDIPAGRLKTRVYESARKSHHPVLVVLVHGDITNGRQGLYGFAQVLADNWEDVVAAAVLRPGYRDIENDVSSGKTGASIGDNYTPEVVDAVDAAIRQLKAAYHARAVVLVGHSGGGAISADLIGRHPQDVDGALLLACGCDPNEFMTRFVREHPGLQMVRPNPSLLPLDLAPKVSTRTHVRMVIGDKDDVVLLPPSQAYAHALGARGVDVKLVVAPGVGHDDVIRSNETRAALREMLTLEGAKTLPRPPAAASGP